MNYPSLKKFLILEDNPGDALICKYIIANKFPDASTTITETLAECLELLRNHSFDCVLADLGLHDAHGESIIAEIISLAPELVVVVITGNTDSEIALKTIQFGAGDYIEKRELNPQSLYKSIIYSCERKANSNALKASEEKFRSVVTSASDTIATISPDFRLLFINKPDGIFEQVPMGKPVFQALSSENHKLLKETFESVIHTGKTAHINLVLNEGSETEIWYSINIGPNIIRGEMNGFVLISRDITQQKLDEKKIHLLNQQLRAFSTHLERVREDERMHLSREIHDELGQQLTSIKFLFAQLGKHHAGKDPKSEDLIQQGTEIITNTIKTVRRIATDLRPGMIEDLGLLAALEWQIQEFTKRTGIPCTHKIEHLSDHYPSYINNVLFRLVQESLHNITKHAEATSAAVQIEVDADQIIHLTITDDGKGIDMEETKIRGKLGITGMTERVAHLNGTFEIGPGASKGTTVNITIPIPE